MAVSIIDPTLFASYGDSSEYSAINGSTMEALTGDYANLDECFNEMAAKEPNF